MALSSHPPEVHLCWSLGAFSVPDSVLGMSTRMARQRGPQPGVEGAAVRPKQDFERRAGGRGIPGPVGAQRGM